MKSNYAIQYNTNAPDAMTLRARTTCGQCAVGGAQTKLQNPVVCSDNRHPNGGSMVFFGEGPALAIRGPVMDGLPSECFTSSWQLCVVEIHISGTIGEMYFVSITE